MKWLIALLRNKKSGMNFKLHHLGYVTDNISRTLNEFRILGYTESEIVKDEIQNVNICFLTKEDTLMIELVEPADERSSVHKMLKKNGVSPYHICYEVEDISKAFDYLTETEGYIPLFRPVEAAAMDNRLICYLYKKEVGFVEIVSKI